MKNSSKQFNFENHSILKWSKNLILLLFLIPLLATSQTAEESRIFENVQLKADHTKIAQFEKGLAAHNKKYHKEGAFGASIFWIANGPDSGSYVWSMGSFPWSELDNRPMAANGHDADWDANVVPFMAADSGNTGYWKINTAISRFPVDFTLKNLLVDYYDVKRGKMTDALKLVEKMQKVYADKLPNESFGIYTNEFPNAKEGRDLAVISFYDKSAWLGKDNDLKGKYDAVHGAGSFEKFISEWMELTENSSTEMWIFREDLSGNDANVKALPKK